MKKGLLLFIHGLGSNEKKTWGTFKSILFDDREIMNLYDIDFFKYTTKKIYIPFRKNLLSIANVSKSLKTQINASYDQYTEIILVCHSMGGLIARKYLLDEYASGAKLKVFKIIFYSVPHNGAMLATIAKYFSIFNLQIRQLCKDSYFIEHLNQEWETKRMRRAFSLLYIAGGQDKVVGIKNATHYVGNEHSKIIEDKSHSNITCLNSSKDISYIVFKKHILYDEFIGPSDSLLDSFITTIKIRFRLSDSHIAYSVEKDLVQIELSNNKLTKIFEFERSELSKRYWYHIKELEATIEEFVHG